MAPVSLDVSGLGMAKKTEKDGTHSIRLYSRRIREFSIISLQRSLEFCVKWYKEVDESGGSQRVRTQIRPEYKYQRVRAHGHHATSPIQFTLTPEEPKQQTHAAPSLET